MGDGQAFPHELDPAGLAEKLSRRLRLGKWLPPALLIAVLGSGFLTFVAFTGWGPFPLIKQNAATILTLLSIDLVLLLFLGVVVARRLVKLWVERRRGQAGSSLHVRLVLLFSLAAIMPTALVAVTSIMFFNLGLQGWFSERVRTALSESLSVANAYLEEHQRVIIGDALAMANDISRGGPSLYRNPQRLTQVVTTQAALRALPEAVVFDEDGRVIGRSGLAFAIELSIDAIPYWAFEKARNGDVAVLTTNEDDRVRALVSLNTGITETFLYVGRFVDPKVIGYMERTRRATAEYESAEGSRNSIEITTTLIFGVIALLLLLAAIWFGLKVANQLATPIAGLINAAERLRAGDLTARVNETATDELGVLTRAFNRMAEQLATQRQDLILANRQLDERRRFTETVLEGVSAGVIGLDREMKVTLPNRSACDLLGADWSEMAGQGLSELLPELDEMIDAIHRRPDKLHQAEIRITRDGRPRTLLVRLAVEQLAGETVGYVVTFDDISELLSAQRKAAWADVARRIAHEIKNPLTPIQLSAERLKRKYLKEIQSDPETFIACTDTIVRQVGDIGRMVDEFSSFARMPAPVIKRENLSALIRDAAFLANTGFPDIAFETDLPEGPTEVAVDSRQIGQVFTNLLKNAAEAIEGREGPDSPPGRVHVAARRTPDSVVIEVLDNGRGLPPEQRDRLTEPYVTTRAKGTGLGLAIVKKIVEDHGGELALEDAPGGGALVRLILPVDQPNSPSNAAEAETSHGA